MRQIIDHNTKTISVHMESDDSFMDMGNVSTHIARGYKIKIFDIEGKELPRNNHFEAELREQYRDKTDLTLPLKTN